MIFVGLELVEETRYGFRCDDCDVCETHLEKFEAEILDTGIMAFDLIKDKNELQIKLTVSTMLMLVETKYKWVVMFLHNHLNHKVFIVDEYGHSYKNAREIKN